MQCLRLQTSKAKAAGEQQGVEPLANGRSQGRVDTSLKVQVPRCCGKMIRAYTATQQESVLCLRLSGSGIMKSYVYFNNNGHEEQ